MTPYLYAARRPLAILVLLAALGAGLSIYLWLLPLGLLTYIAMVVVGGRDPALAAASQRAPRPRLSSATFRTQLDLIERTHNEIQRSISQSDGPLARLMARISDQTGDLVEQAYALSTKGQIIESYMAQVNLKELQQRLTKTDYQISATVDQYTLQQLQETRVAIAEKQRNYAALITYIGRIQAQLQNIHANLDNVLAETVRLRTADAVSADSATNQVAQRLSDLQSDMNAFQQVLDTALAGAGAA